MSSPVLSVLLIAAGIATIVIALFGMRTWVTQQQTIQPVTTTAEPTPSRSKIGIELKHEDAPQFKRTYTADLPNGGHISITMHTFLNRRTDESAELTQRDGKWVLFDVNAVADKIIDRDLVPIVQQLTDQILRLDADFIKEKPSEFVDSDGTTWIRKPR